MTNEQSEYWSRRQFLGRVAAVGAAGVLGSSLGRAAADLWSKPPSALAAGLPPETKTIRLFVQALVPNVPLETTRLRLLKFISTCAAPLYLAEDYLKDEGFTDVKYVPTEGGVAARNLAAGEVDMGLNFVAPNIIRLEQGDPVVILGGVHVGCFELFATDRVRAIRDLKGKRVAVPLGIGGAEHVFIASVAAHIGLDPNKDIIWVTEPREKSIKMLAEGKIDAFMAFPPITQELKEQRIGHVVLNSMMDRPWSQYFCCMVVGHREFVRKHPAATQRVIRAIFKTTDRIFRDPGWAARMLVAKGFAKRYDHALQLIKEVAYDRWRNYDAEDTVRYYALRLREAGMIKSSPQQIIAGWTDWRFLNELKKELKGSEPNRQDHLGHLGHLHLGG